MGAVDLVIVVFGAAGGAELYVENLKKLPEETAIPLLDMVTVVKDRYGTATVTQTLDVDAGEGAKVGAVGGALLGLLGGPLGVLIGAVAGAMVGGVTADQVDIGVPDNLLESIADRLKSSTSAFLTLCDPEYVPALEGLIGILGNLSKVEFFHHTIKGAAADHLIEKTKQKGKPGGEA